MKLNGLIGNITNDDTVQIPGNTLATLNGTIIKSDVWVRSAATLISNGPKRDGNVQAFDACLKGTPNSNLRPPDQFL